MPKTKPQQPFFWGAAISAHQTEGKNTASDWWAFERDTIAHQGIEESGDAVDHWNRFREDIDLLANAGLNAFRFSIEWAKVEPEEGRIDENALKHYDNVIAHARSRGLHICLTLWHFTLPQWAAAKGGILSRDVRRRFTAYAECCARRYVGAVDLWQTMNEPIVYIKEGYRTGRWPPGIRSPWTALRAFLALRSMHRETYNALKRCGAVRVGIAKSVIAHLTAGGALIRAMFGFRQAFKNFIWNASFFVGEWTRHDFVGINYYITDTLGAPKDERPHDDMGWRSQPEGLSYAIAWAAQAGKPVYVTENGIATNDDRMRVAYLHDHLAVIDRARRSGVRIEGYFYWSLLDNFEWDQGFSKHFGFIAVDPTSYERTPKSSFRCFGEHARTNP